MVFLLLAFGFVVFISCNLANPITRSILSKSPKGMLELWVDLLNRTPEEPQSGETRFIFPYTLVKKSVVHAVLAAFTYVFMEWVFTLGKPSFLDSLNWGEKLEVFLINGIAVAVLMVLSLGAIVLLDILFTPLVPSFRKYAIHLPVSFLLTCLCLLLIDNFTYTIINFSTYDVSTSVKILYAFAFFSGVIAFVWIFSKNIAQGDNPGLSNFKLIIALLLSVPSLVLLGIGFISKSSDKSEQVGSAAGNSLPNIILLSTDALTSENMSVYGYERDTTPFIRELASSSLVGLNHFTNSTYSPGSETALLTGKLAITTRVLYYPNTLQGKDAYQHLPGILKSYGYRTVSLGVDYFVDTEALNFQNAFDVVNCRKETRLIPTGYLSNFDNEVYFFNTLEERISDRLLNIFLIKDIQNPFSLVVQADDNTKEDQWRMTCFYSELDNAIRTKIPLFAHIHMMGTHGDQYYPNVRLFSDGIVQSEPNMVDFYDDAILDYDRLVQRMVQELIKIGQYENTVLVLYSDHSQQYDARDRIPLIIHFPKGEHNGVIKTNTQNIDIVPTILDYLKIDQPAWIEGQSLLQKNEPDRLMISASSVEREFGQTGIPFLPQKNLKPPFYQFGALTIIQCQNWYQVDLQKSILTYGELESYEYPCPVDVLDTKVEIQKRVADLLSERGFSLPKDWYLSSEAPAD